MRLSPSTCHRFGRQRGSRAVAAGQQFDPPDLHAVTLEFGEALCVRELRGVEEDVAVQFVLRYRTF
jgi:hypothetical protein